MWFLPFFGSGIIGKIISLGLNLAYEITLKLIGLIFYLASEYWGRWVLAGLAVFALLCYGRWHYMELGRSQEAHFRSLVLEAELEQRCEAKNGILREKPRNDWRLPEGWPSI